MRTNIGKNALSLATAAALALTLCPISAIAVEGITDGTSTGDTPTKTQRVIGSVKLSKTSYTYNGTVRTPSVKAYDTTGARISASKFKVTYSSGRKGVGTYRVKVTGIGTVTGSVATSFSVKRRAISTATIKLSQKKYTYTGAAKTPKVTVTYRGKKLAKGTAYTVTYKNNRTAGTAKVVVKGKGNFKGKKTLTFSIVKKKSPSSSSSSSASSGYCWITASGRGVAYHSTPSCPSLSRSTPVKISVSSAKAQGLHACPNCH